MIFAISDIYNFDLWAHSDLTHISQEIVVCSHNWSASAPVFCVWNWGHTHANLLKITTQKLALPEKNNIPRFLSPPTANVRCIYDVGSWPAGRTLAGRTNIILLRDCLGPCIANVTIAASSFLRIIRAELSSGVRWWSVTSLGTLWMIKFSK